jgi:anti-sigma regulatory factor (Ser/Thr protein kinase)
VLAAAELVVSELATNALAFSASGWFVVEVRADPGFARVAVADLGGSAEPQVSPSGQPDGTQTGGRGLYIVASLAKQWGWEPAGAGRRVWAELADDSL